MDGHEFKGKLWQINKHNCPEELHHLFEEPFTKSQFEAKILQTHASISFGDAIKARWIRKVKAWIPNENLTHTFVEQTKPSLPTVEI